jgi:6-phosphogluconolactonase
MEDVLTGADAWARAAATRVAGLLSRIAAEREGGTTVSLALAGGSTPAPVYRALADLDDVPWARVEIFFGDERAVPPNHPESNFRMARETLLEPAGLPEERVHRMEAERADRDRAADDYARTLPARLDMLLLGVGSDGHTASLFPGAPTLRERERLVVPAGPPAEGGMWRLTVTPPVLEAAAHVFVLARGPDKAEAVARALEGGWAPEECPAQLVRGGAWLLDAGAAGKLEKADPEHPGPDHLEVLHEQGGARRAWPPRSTGREEVAPEERAAREERGA